MTIFDFVLIDSSMISFNIFSSLIIIFFALVSIIFLSFLLPIKPYLITSPSPDLYSFSGNVFKKWVDIRTNFGL